MPRSQEAFILQNILYFLGMVLYTISAAQDNILPSKHIFGKNVWFAVMPCGDERYRDRTKLRFSLRSFSSAFWSRFPGGRAFFHTKRIELAHYEEGAGCGILINSWPDSKRGERRDGDQTVRMSPTAGG